jgi:hypothetical protein
MPSAGRQFFDQRRLGIGMQAIKNLSLLHKWRTRGLAAHKLLVSFGNLSPLPIVADDRVKMDRLPHETG